MRSRNGADMRRGAIILCGGRSTRMGRDKATLPFGPETLLQRVVRLLGEVVPTESIVVVAAATQTLPDLSLGVSVTRDEHPERGPLEGLAGGLRTLGDRVDACYATACDVPFLAPAFVRRMFALLGEHDAAVPQDGQFTHPLAAVYRPRVLPAVESLLAADRLRASGLFAECRTQFVTVDSLRDVDPPLTTLANLNQPADYQAALAQAGFAP